LARPLLPALCSTPAPVVLDVATGTARLPMALLRQWGFHGRIVGLDLSTRMLTLAQRKSATQSNRVGLVHADAMRLPFADGTFHAVTSLEALELLPDSARALGEMVRVLRPGGRLLVSNRIGMDARLLPGRACRPQLVEQRLGGLGLAHVQTRRWQRHYDLVQAEKPLAGQQPHA
jgi:SAM-dependent methyltransferase